MNWIEEKKNVLVLKHPREERKPSKEIEMRRVRYVDQVIRHKMFLTKKNRGKDNSKEMKRKVKGKLLTPAAA